MKRRTRWVSNSSSSGYCIVIRKGVTKENFLEGLQLPERHPLRGSYGELFQYLMKDKYCHVIRTADELLSYLREDYLYEDTYKTLDEALQDEDVPSFYKDCAEHIKDGGGFILCSLSYNEDQTEMQYGAMLDAIADTDDIQVISRY